MAIENQSFVISITAGESLSGSVAGTGHLNKAIAIDDRQVAVTGRESFGLLQNNGHSGEHVAIGVAGFAKYTAGAAISAGAQLTFTTSGYAITATSGSYSVGRAFDSNVASGEVAMGLFGFATPVYIDGSSAHISSYETFTFTAQADLSAAGAVGKAVVTNSGDFAATSTPANAILYTGTVSGGTSVSRSHGKLQARAGDVITAGRSLKVSSGFLVPANSGDVIVGRALAASAAGNSGSLFSADVSFSQARYAVNCLHVSYGI